MNSKDQSTNKHVHIDSHVVKAIQDSFLKGTTMKELKEAFNLPTRLIKKAIRDRRKNEV